MDDKPRVLLDEKLMPEHMRLSIDKKLYDRIVAGHGIENAARICEVSNE